MTRSNQGDRVAAESLLPQPLTDESSKTHSIESETRLSSIGPEAPVKGYRLRRFWGRTLVILLVPIAITAFYFWIWWYCLRESSPIKYAPFNQSWINYVWFIIAIFGLDLSRHGFMGVEAAMLQSPTLRARNAMTVLMHSGATWSGPGGWVKFIKMVLTGQATKFTGYMWWLLALLSIMPFLAFPLSGLTMELADGYVPVHNKPAMVIGHTWNDFNQRQFQQTIERGSAAWKNGLAAELPGFGVAYTPPYIDRGALDFLAQYPNSFPSKRGISELFLTPQAATPIGGHAWGLLVGYNCSVLQSASELTVLNQKSTVRERAWGGNYDVTYLRLATPSEMFIYAFNASNQGINDRGASFRATNLWAYGEMGVSIKPDDTTYDGTEPNFPAADAQGVADVLEYVLWQVRFNSDYPEADDMIVFNTTMMPSITGLGSPFILQSDGTYATNRSFFAQADGDTEILGLVNPDHLRAIKNIAEPIGVRCHRVSGVGEGKLDIQRNTFSSFERSASPFFNPSVMELRTPRFGCTTTNILAGRYLDLFTSVNDEPPLTYSNSVVYDKFVQPDLLLEAILRAHAVDALELMYDGATSMNGAYAHPNLTTARKGSVLGPGVVPAVLPAVLFAIWCLGSVVLGVFYGLHRRWSATLDGFSLFCFGADFADQLSDRNDMSRVQPFDKCDTLAKLPGMVGDARVKFDVGHVSLVDRTGVFNPRKLFS